jgi:two-component system, NarL family, nitrate/nitrite response regulator NarL
MAGTTVPIRVHVVAEVRLHREGLADMLSRQAGLQVVGASGCSAADLVHVAASRADVVLVDMEVGTSVGLVRALASPDGSKVIALAIRESDAEVVACAEAGVAGYATRDQSVDDVVAVIQSVARDETLCSPRMAAALLRHIGMMAEGQPAGAAAEPRLTARELEVVGLIERRMSNKQIARQLSIEVTTVKNHVHNILKKAQVQRREEIPERVRAQKYLRALRANSMAA